MRVSAICLGAVVLVCACGAKAQQLSAAITVDDLPAHGALPPGETRLAVAQSMLATFRRETLPPVYGFINAGKLEEKQTGEPDRMDVLRAWRRAGQPLGSHTFTHSNLDSESAAAFEEDIAKNEPVLRELMKHKDWHWLRYPFLHEGDTVEKREEVRGYLQQHGYRIAEVSLDFEDYLWNNPYARCVAKHDDAAIAELEKSYLATADEYIGVFREMTHTLYGRDIPYVLLLHVGAFDARMLPKLVALLRERGFSFTTLEKAESDPVYSEDAAIGLRGGGTLQEFVAAKRKLKWPRNSKPYQELDAACR